MFDFYNTKPAKCIREATNFIDHVTSYWTGCEVVQCDGSVFTDVAFTTDSSGKVIGHIYDTTAKDIKDYRLVLDTNAWVDIFHNELVSELMVRVELSVLQIIVPEVVLKELTHGASTWADERQKLAASQAIEFIGQKNFTIVSKDIRRNNQVTKFIREHNFFGSNPDDRRRIEVLDVYQEKASRAMRSCLNDLIITETAVAVFLEKKTGVVFITNDIQSTILLSYEDRTDASNNQLYRWSIAEFLTETKTIRP